MPVVLSQRTLREHSKYLDREGVIYHYPRYYGPATDAPAREYLEWHSDVRFKG